METKICSKCKQEKSIEFFSKNASKKDGLCTECKECHKIYRNKHYSEHREYYLLKSKEYRKKQREIFKELKETLQCEVCGDNIWWVLDFHHIDGSLKEKNLSELIGSPKKMKKELSKCKVLCANCHRDLHYKEKLLVP